MSVPTGIHALTLDDASGAVARSWLDDHHHRVPPFYTSNNVLVQHIDRAVRSVTEFLSGRKHTNRVTHREFAGIVYLADNPTLKPFSVIVDETHVVIIGAQWVFGLTKICDRLSEALALRPRSGPARVVRPSGPARDELLAQLLSDDVAVTEAEAIAIAESWPSPHLNHTEEDLGPWAVFYDLIRLVWFHELAHALCGHIDYAGADLLLFGVHESTAGGERETTTSPGDDGLSEKLQCLEMHADEFAVRTSIGEILYGQDPAGLMVSVSVDLGDRLLHLNTAFCVFALLWELDENRSRASGHVTGARSHPPVGLRYDRFRGFQRQLAQDYSSDLLTVVDTLSLGFLETLQAVCPYFGGLFVLTPLVFRTPQMDAMEAYEAHLMLREAGIADALERYNYVPAEFLA